MEISGQSAHADQLHAEVRDARDCDALEPCTLCQAKIGRMRAARRGARLARLAGDQPTVPAPRAPTMLQQRLAT